LKFGPNNHVDSSPPLELDEERIRELIKAGYPVTKMSRELGIPKTSLLRYLDKRGIVLNSRKQNWVDIIEHIRDVDLPFYQRSRMYPLALRQLYYRLIELGIITKSKSDYTQLCAKTAEARRGVDSTFTKESRYPELPIDCFIDDKKFPIGQSDMEKGPRDPTPDLAPTDPYEVTKDAIDQLITTIFKYDGRCERGSPGFNPGRWYNQPYYVELWVESANLQTTLLRAAGDKKVVVVANGGLGNHPNILKNCERLKKINEEYPDKQIVILYFGDFDSTGLFIDGLLQKALDYHGVENFEVRRIAITPRTDSEISPN
jgi:hypothetical protein